MVRGELGKQNRRRCSITVLEGLRGEFTRTQYLLRLAEESLPKGESQGKLWMLYTGVRCRFWLMVKQKFLVDDEPSASAIIKEEQIFSYVVNAERGSSI